MSLKGWGTRDPRWFTFLTGDILYADGVSKPAQYQSGPLYFVEPMKYFFLTIDKPSTFIGGDSIYVWKSYDAINAAGQQGRE